MHIKFQKNGLTKEVKVGFSWTIFCFGWMALAIRGQYVPALISFLTFNMASFYFMFAGNRLLAFQLVENGWTTNEKKPESWGCL